MFEQGLNPLLCDQMGLGKTVQVIAFFQHLFERVQAGPFLVVCPNSLLGNWVSEIKRFSDTLRVWPYWGSVGQRKTIRAGFAHLVHVREALDAGADPGQFAAEELFGARECPVHVVVTSYSLAVQDLRHLGRVPWLSIVLDEGQMIKSSETRRWAALMQYKAANKVLLSGTPVQNTLAELWSLLHFVMPGVFRSRESFAEWFGRDVEAAAAGGIRLSSE